MIGELRKRVTVQLSTPRATGKFNEQSPAFTDDQTRWAGIEPKSVSKIEWHGEQAAEVSTVVTMRYYRGLTSTARIKYVDSTGVTRYFLILGVLDLQEQHWYTVCFCKELPDAGVS